MGVGISLLYDESVCLCLPGNGWAVGMRYEVSRKWDGWMGGGTDLFFCSGIGLPGYLTVCNVCLWPQVSVIGRGSFEEEEEESFLYALSDNLLILTLGGHFCTDPRAGLGHLSPPSWAGTLCAQSVSIPPFSIPEVGSSSPSYV